MAHRQSLSSLELARVTSQSKPASITGDTSLTNGHLGHGDGDDQRLHLQEVSYRPSQQLSGHDPAPVAAVKESWRKPRINALRLAASSFAFFNLGIHDAAYGPLIPSLEKHYGLNYTTVSLVFLATFPGYVLAATTTDKIHLWLGVRGVAALASTLRLATYIALALHPPWPVIIVLLVFCGWGNGLLDAAWNAWVSGLDKPNELLGLLHSLYGLGAALSPLIASTMIDKQKLPWWTFYYIPLGLTLLELITGVGAFWREDAAAFRASNAASGATKGRLRAALKLRPTWIIALFLLLYVGAEVSLSGWIVTFMIRQRGAQPFPSAMTATGFWLGVTVGRFVLGFVTGKLGERWTIVIYLLIGMGLELIFWLVPKFLVSAVAIALLGFVLGPMFPASVVVLSKLLPKHLHVGAISFTAALGMGGAAVIPFGVGAIASAAGVQALQPIILSLLAVLTGLWLTLPKVKENSRVD